METLFLTLPPPTPLKNSNQLHQLHFTTTPKFDFHIYNFNNNHIKIIFCLDNNGGVIENVKKYQRNYHSNLMNIANIPFSSKKDIKVAAFASPSACTIFCCLSWIAFSTWNWALCASCWAMRNQRSLHLVLSCTL